MNDVESEHEGLIERILYSQEFAGAEKRRDLLRFLFRRRDQKLSAKEIEIEHYQVSTKHPRFDEGHARNRCDDLRVALKKYSDSGAEKKWRCELPKGDRSSGFMLKFSEINNQLSGSEAFWRAHAEMKETVIVVCGDHLFFFDRSVNKVFRLYDLNTDGTREEMLLALQRMTGEPVDKLLMEASHNYYLATGEVRAHEILQKWFHERHNILLPRRTCRELAAGEYQKASPILLGREETNIFIRKIINSSEGAHFAYRLHSSIGAVKIKQPTEQEVRALSEYPLTLEGILGPVSNWDSVFGIVTRLPHPGGRRHITMICFHYYSKVTAQIMEALTDEDLFRDLIRDMKLPLDFEWPDSFEILFSVKLSPGDVEGEGVAKFLCWRSYGDAGAV